MLTQARLKELLRYDRRTGMFYARVARLRRPVGVRVGYINNVNKYRYIWLDGKFYKTARLAWLYVYGCFPEQVDHKNRVRDDDRIANLREATRYQNHANSKTRPSKSGLKGAHWHRREGMWRSSIRTPNKGRIHLGVFATAEEAHVAYCKAAKKLHGEFYASRSDFPLVTRG